jgi:hypothetical protein
MEGPPHKRKARPACHQNAPILTQSSAANNGTDATIGQLEREQRKLPDITQDRFWHARAVEHQQRLLIIRLLASIDRKLELLLESKALP